MKRRIKKRFITNGKSIPRSNYRITNTLNTHGKKGNNTIRSHPKDCPKGFKICRMRAGSNTDYPEYDGMGNMVGGGWYWDCCPMQDTGTGRSRSGGGNGGGLRRPCPGGCPPGHYCVPGYYVQGSSNSRSGPAFEVGGYHVPPSCQPNARGGSR